MTFRRSVLRSVTICVALGAAAYGLVAPGPAQAAQAAQIVATGPIASTATPGDCLDDYNDQAYSGAPVDLATCDISPAQQWTLMTDGTVQINGMCLTAQNNSPNAPPSVAQAWLYPCTGSASQQWTSAGSGTLVPKAPLYPDNQGCLDASGAAAGAALTIDTCAGAAAQQWSVPTYGEAASVTDPGGDITISADDGGADPNVIRQVLSASLPEALGLPDGASVNDMVQAELGRAKSLMTKAGDGPPASEDPASIPDASISVDGSTITLTIPAADVDQIRTSGIVEWGINIISVAAAILGYVIPAAFCMAAATPLIPGPFVAIAGWAVFGCNTWAQIVSYAVYYGVYYALEPDSYHPPAWQTLLGTVIIAGGLAAFNIGVIGPFVRDTIPTLVHGVLANRVGGLVANLLRFFTTRLNGVWLKRAYFAISAIEGLATAAIAAWQALVALTPGASFPVRGPGQIISAIPPSSTHPAGLCLDNSGGALIPGNPVGIFDCLPTTGPAYQGEQNWTMWSNGAITVDGKCLTAPGAQLPSELIIADCTGNPTTGALDPSQHWTYIQATSQLLAANSGGCLEDPDEGTINNTPQQVNTCSTGAVKQQWTLP